MRFIKVKETYINTEDICLVGLNSDFNRAELAQRLAMFEVYIKLRNNTVIYAMKRDCRQLFSFLDNRWKMK